MLLRSQPFFSVVAALRPIGALGRTSGPAMASSAVAQMPVSISAAFDGGNIEFVSSSCSASSASVVELRLRPDPLTELEQKRHMQWFAFRALPTASTSKVRYEIVNAADASYPEAWDGSAVCFSYDRLEWSRSWSTSYDSTSGTLSWEFDHAHRPGVPVYFAYFDLYPYERHLDLVDRAAASPRASVRSLGQTVQGRELECVEVGNGNLHVWVIHRQHPGETQASFYAEGLVTRLLGLGAANGRVDGLTSKLLERCTFHVVPHMNPDGAVMGHLRTNALGANLNREWATTEMYQAPTLERSPEVVHALAAMDASGVDLFVDVHGDEELPYAFVAGAEGCEVWGPRQEKLQGAFVAAYSRANSDMQTKFGYDPEPPKGANYAICSNQIAQRFDCVSVTLEMPFKNSAANHDRDAPFDGSRAAMLGASLLDAIAHVAPQLRPQGDEQGTPVFGPEDEYVVPTEKYRLDVVDA